MRQRRREHHCWALALVPLVCASALAQSENEIVMRTQPALIFSEPPKRDYNLRLGPVNGRFFGSIQMEYSDNINLSAIDPQSDVYFFPNFGVGFQWPLSPQNILEFSLGLGYRAYIDHPELNSLQITPDSKLKYHMRIGRINLELHDQFQLQVDPLSRADISGGEGLINFQRIINDLGLQAQWPARKNLTIASSYDYVIDRSVNDEFTSLDRDDHTVAGGAFTKLGSAWTVGMNAAFTVTDYLRRIQNDGVSYSFGPHVSFKATRFITLDANVAYTHSEFDQSGTITDDSEFNGMSFAVAIRHTINSKMSHQLRGSRSVSPGFGSNFNDLSVLQYGLSWRLNSFISLNTTFAYEHLEQSGDGEIADRYIWYVGAGWQVARGWTLGVGYSFAWKDSDVAQRDYRQNRVTLDLTHDF